MSCKPPKMMEWPTLATFHDQRSTPDAVPWGRWRLVENMATIDGKWQRRCGWKRHGHWMSLYENADLSSRLVDATLPIDALYTHISPSGRRRLFAATAENVYSQFHDGRWRVLGDWTAGRRHQFASVGDLVFTSNDTDNVRYHVLDEVDDAEGQAFHDIAETEDIGLSKAGMIGSWQGILFLGNVVMDGVRVGHRVLWSDRENPLKLVPATDNVAGFQDLNPGEVVLTGVPMVDAYYIFTTQSIWRVSIVGGDAFLAFQQVYHNRNGIGCLSARDSLVLWRDNAVYLSNDGIQTFGPYSAAPEQPAWMHHATYGLTQTTADQCNLIVGGVRATYGELWFSYPVGEGTSNSRTVVLNMDYQSSDEIDHGFTAIHATQIDDSIEVVEWLRTTVGCSSDAIDALFPPGREDSRPVSSGEPQTLAELCEDEDNFPTCDSCVPAERFLVVSATDNNIKSVEPDYFARDQYVTSQFVATGYGVRWVTGALHFGQTEWKRATEVLVDLYPGATDDVRKLNLSVSVSGTPVDVLSETCSIRAFELTPKDIECPATNAGTKQPNAHLRWPIMVEGRYLYFDFSMDEVTGGAFEVSRFVLGVGPSPSTTR